MKGQKNCKSPLLSKSLFRQQVSVTLQLSPPWKSIFNPKLASSISEEQRENCHFSDPFLVPTVPSSCRNSRLLERNGEEPGSSGPTPAKSSSYHVRCRSGMFAVDLSGHSTPSTRSASIPSSTTRASRLLKPWPVKPATSNEPERSPSREGWSNTSLIKNGICCSKTWTIFLRSIPSTAPALSLQKIGRSPRENPSKKKEKRPVAARHRSSCLTRFRLW